MVLCSSISIHFLCIFFFCSLRRNIYKRHLSLSSAYFCFVLTTPPFCFLVQYTERIHIYTLYRVLINRLLSVCYTINNNKQAGLSTLDFISTSPIHNHLGALFTKGSLFYCLTYSRAAIGQPPCPRQSRNKEKKASPRSDPVGNASA